MNEDIKLTKLAKCAGCGAKAGAGMLSKLLEGLPVNVDEKLIVGYDTSDDASVYLVSDDLCIVQTLDFFPPIVDDPYTFGKIAAANSLSDIFAMGANPKLAMNILCTSTKMSEEDTRALLRGGYEKVYEAGAVITGGHTIVGEEPKYGLSVTGFAHPNEIRKNSSAQEGDVLILTKPLGVGILTTAKRGNIEAKGYEQAVEQMSTLNKVAAEIARDFEVHACTDVTGFGLIGHTLELAQGSGLTANIIFGDVPILPDVYALAQMGILPQGMYRNREFAELRTAVEGDVDTAMQDILYDPQTSGGLLMAVSSRDAHNLQKRLSDSIPCASIIGYVTEFSSHAVVIKSR